MAAALSCLVEPAWMLPRSGSTSRSATSGPRREATRSNTLTSPPPRPEGVLPERGSTKSSDARPTPPTERIPDRRTGTSLAGAPRTSPSGKGCNFPPENSSARLARVASSWSPSPSSEHMASPSGTLVEQRGGPRPPAARAAPSSAASHRGAPARTRSRWPGRRWPGRRWPGRRWLWPVARLPG